jgi:hypothetical protein
MDVVQAQGVQLKALLGSAVAAFVLTMGLAQAANLDSEVKLPPPVVSDFSGADLLSGMARAVALGDWAGLPFALPPGWEKPLIAALGQPDCPTDITQMLVLGEAALRSGFPKLSYAVSVAGLANGTADARFLFLRGRALSGWQPQRRDGCLTAALELARRERNLPLTGKILDQMRDNTDSYWGFDFIDDPSSAGRPLASDLLNEILEEERAEKQFPSSGRNRPPTYGSKLESINCDCPKCRAQRGEPVDDWDDDEDMDDFAEDDKFDEMMDQLEEVLDRLPPQIARKVEAAIARGEQPGIALAKILGDVLPETAPPRPERKAKKRTGKLPPPEQSNLF